jgi:hypothetical protein
MDSFLNAWFEITQAKSTRKVHGTPRAKAFASFAMLQVERRTNVPRVAKT